MRTFILFIILGALTCHAGSDICFLPCETNASVSFEGITQAGHETHRLEVRRLAYLPQKTKEQLRTMRCCVIYYAGDDYGPFILRQIDDCVEPLVKKTSKTIVEIYFTAGAHTHIRQKWRLLGDTAKLEKEEGIEWSEDPRMKSKDISR